MDTFLPAAAEARVSTSGMNQSQFQNAASAAIDTTGMPIHASLRVARDMPMLAKREARGLVCFRRHDVLVLFRQ
jgi:hypothetical protein